MTKKNICLPSREQLMSLPRWAGVAFLARCGRRAQPLFRGSEQVAQLIANALGVAEEAARFGFDLGGSEAAALNLMEAAGAENCRLDSAVLVACYAAQCCALAFLDEMAGTNSHEAQVKSAAGALGVVEQAAADPDWLAVAEQIVADFERLIQQAAVHGWTEQTRVSPEAFGP